MNSSDSYGTATILETKVIPFNSLTTDLLEFEHDPSCRTKEGLYKEMCKVYPNFNENEIVTLVYFVLK